MAKRTLIFVDLSGSVSQGVAPNKSLLETWKDGIRNMMRKNEGHGTYTIVGLGSGGWNDNTPPRGGRIIGENMTPSEVRKILGKGKGFTGAWSCMGGTVPLTKELVEKYSKKMGGHTDLIYYTDADEYDGYGLGAETFGAEQFGAESRFSKLQNKVAKQYEEDGYTKEEAMKIGGAVAYDSGVKKYGKQGMKKLTTKGIKKAQKRRARKSNSKARTMARKGARRSKALAYSAEGAYSYSRSAESRAADTMSWENSAPYATLKGYNPVDSVQEYPPLGYGVTQNFGSEHEQGYDDREDESLGMSDDESGMEQDFQDRRDESAGMERHGGRRKYARVGTMDEHDRFDTEYESPYGTRQTTDFGLVGMGNDFAQNRAEQFEAKSGKRTRIGNRYVTRNKRGQIRTNVNVGRSLTADRRQRAKNHADPGYGHQGDNLRAETFAAEDGNQFMTGARYGAGAVLGITGATLILGSIVSIFTRK